MDQLLSSELRGWGWHVSKEGSHRFRFEEAAPLPAIAAGAGAVAQGDDEGRALASSLRSSAQVVPVDADADPPDAGEGRAGRARIVERCNCSDTSGGRYLSFAPLISPHQSHQFIYM